LDSPNEIAIETLAVIAERSGVQPSAIVRFAKSFGYEGASDMQRVFRDGLLAGDHALGYGERVRKFNEAVDGKSIRGGAEVLDEFIEGNTLAMGMLRQTVSERDINSAVKLLRQAETVFVVGFRRSFPVASYLAYSLQQVEKRTIFIDGVAGFARQQAQSIGKNDLLIAVSYHPYAAETVQVVEIAVERGSKVLAISDNVVNPVAKPATTVLQVRDAEIRKFRSLGASMCLAQVLVIAHALDSTRRQR
jgi:DNA-binding MurR/RpiR family transcriptional regulator